MKRKIKKPIKSRMVDNKILKKIERLEKKVDKLTQIAAASRLATKPSKSNLKPKKLSKYNKFVKKGLKQGKTMSELAKQWSKK